MNIAFVGKGGSGKTTISSLFISYLASRGSRVLAVDGDINQHLQQALGISVTPPALAEFEKEIAEFVKGENPNIREAAHVTRSTPPGLGSGMISFESPLFEKIAVKERGIAFLRSGEFHEDEVGMGCYHSKIIPLEILLHHLDFATDEYAVVDMTAGADMFSSGMFLNFDVVVIVVEPTHKSVAVYQQFKEYLAPYHIPLYVVANKIQDEHDVKFLEERLGFVPLIVPQLATVRARERGEDVSCEQVFVEGGVVFENLYRDVISHPDIREHRLKLLKDFHRLLSVGWYKQRFGYDLSSQIG